jgi:hypothetical protein
MVNYLDSNNILNRWENYFSQLHNVLEVSSVRQTETHTAELLVIEPSSSETEISIEKFKDINYQVILNSTKTDQIRR